MNYRFDNARILTMKDNEAVFDGSLYTKDSEIIYIGPALSPAQEHSVLPAGYVVDQSYDCDGNLLMPGFKNAHAHSGMTPLRSMADDMPLADWLNNQIFPREAQLNAEMIYDATQLSVLEYLTSGITACFDMYLTPESIVNAYKDIGFRGVLCGNLNNFSSSIEEMKEYYERFNSIDPLISYEIGFHAEYTTSPELIEKVRDLAHSYKTPVYVHLSETKGEVSDCMGRYGMSPVKYLDSLDMFKYGGAGFHLVHVDNDDIDILRDKNISVVTNPGSNTKLASGIAPITKYITEGIQIAIGTDGPASNNCLDMFREMFLVTGLAKLLEEDAAVVDAEDVLKMATVGGARVMRLNDSDVLSVGKQADIIMIDLKQPNMQPINNIPKNIVYSGSKSNIKMTMVAGKILYENGAFSSNIDVERLYARVQEIADRIR